MFACVCALFYPESTLKLPTFGVFLRKKGVVVIFLEKSGESRVKRAQNGSKVVKSTAKKGAIFTSNRAEIY